MAASRSAVSSARRSHKARRQASPQDVPALMRQPILDEPADGWVAPVACPLRSSNCLAVGADEPAGGQRLYLEAGQPETGVVQQCLHPRRGPVSKFLGRAEVVGVGA